jgi:sugar/nucleoside kinase (ribokinase family)
MSGVLSPRAASDNGRAKMKCVLGLGVACVDIIACVQSYPEPDEKIRADSVQQFSGGNVGNTLTAISKLGTSAASILTKVGKDSNGDFILDDLRRVNVDVSHVIVTTSAPTLSVYVIVDRQARRTCIASPNEEELTPSEVTSKLCSRIDCVGSDQRSDLFDDVQVT